MYVHTYAYSVFEEVDFDGTKLLCEVTHRERPRPYVPLPLRDQVMASLHAMDHLGWKPSVKRIAHEYYWPTLRNDVKTYVKVCVACMKVKANSKSVADGVFRVGLEFCYFTGSELVDEARVLAPEQPDVIYLKKLHGPSL